MFCFTGRSKYYFIALLAGLLAPFIAMGQSSQIIPPSPDAASLGKFADVPVSNYTGIPSVNIPLYTLNAGKLSLPISLNYHAGGVRVEEESGWVGLSWALQAGGQITRTVKGLNDLGLGGYPYAPAPNTGDDEYLNRVAKGINDSEPDIFYYSFAGRSGKFILQQGGGPQILSQEKLKISYNDGSRSWTVVSEDGTQFLFEIEELTVPASGTGTSAATAISNLTSSASFVSTWHLSQIILTTGERIYLEYNNSNPVHYRSVPSINQELRAIYNVTGVPTCGSYPSTGVQYLASRNMHQGIYLQRIRFHNTRIDFITEDRVDLEPVSSALPQRLKRVNIIKSINGNDNIVKSFELIYGYFNSNLSGYAQKRLKLMGVQEKSGTASLPPHTFGYYTSPTYAFELPSKTSASRDLWGFFNGKNNSNIYSKYFSKNINDCLVPPISENAGGIRMIEDTGADRNPDAEAAKLGSLTKITYPTGGTAEFEYEVHDYFSPWTEPIGSPQHVQLFRYGPLVTNPPSGVPTETILDFSGATDNTPISIYAAIYCHNYQEFGTPCYNRTNYYGDIYKVLADGSETQYASLQIGTNADYTVLETKEFNFNLPAGKYIVRTNNPNDAWVTQLQIDYTIQTGVIEHKNKMAGGLRVAQIKRKSSVTGTEEITGYEYEGSVGASSGVLMNPYAQFHYYEVANVGCPGGGGGAVYYLVRRSINNFPLGSGAQGNHVGYSKVTAVRGGAGENGKSVYTYLNYQEEIDLSVILPDETTIPPNQNGLLLSQTDYRRNVDNSYTPVKSIENIYDDNAPLTESIPSIKVYPVYIDGTAWPGVYKPYFFLSERWELKKQVETLYETDTKYIQTATDYFYENAQHLQLTKQQVTKSDGSKEVVLTTYPDDYAAGTAFIDHMKSASGHLVAYPIEQVRYREVGTTQTILSGTITKYLAGGIGVADQVLELETAAPMALSSFKFSNRAAGQLPPAGGATAFAPHASYALKQTYGNYDAFRNPQQITPALGAATTYIWSYGGQYPVAEIKNGAYSAVLEALGGAAALSAFTSSSPTDAAVETFLAPLRSNAALKTSLVTTYTYDILNGMTSSTDPTGRTTYYEYDGFGRLKAAKDTQQKTKETFDYHYLNQ